MNRDKIKSIRFNETEIEELKRKAKEDNRKLSDFMRCELLRDKKIKGWMDE